MAFLSFLEAKTQIGLVFTSILISNAMWLDSHSSWGALFQLTLVGALTRRHKSLQPFSSVNSIKAFWMSPTITMGSGCSLLIVKSRAYALFPKIFPANMSVAVVPQCSTMYSVPFVCTHVNLKRILLPMFMCILYSCMFCAHLIAPTLAFQAAPSMHTKALHRYVSEQKQEHSLSIIGNFSLENIQKTLSKRPFSCNLNFVYLDNGCGTMSERNLEAINLSGSKYLANSVNYSIHSIGC